jgi:hypothetical protein
LQKSLQVGYTEALYTNDRKNWEFGKANAVDLRRQSGDKAAQREQA